MAEGLVTIVAGLGTWISSGDPKYTPRGKNRIRACGVGAVIGGVGLSTALLPFQIVGVAIVLGAIADRWVTNSPTTRAH